MLSQMRLPQFRTRLVAAAVLPVAVAALSGCTSAPPPADRTQFTAGAGTCKLPTLTVDPTSFKPGDTVKLSGQYYVKGCAGNKGTEPLTLISAVLTDAKGANLDFDPIDAKGANGTFAVEYQVPAKAAAGAGKITVGQAGPVPVVVKH